MVTDISACQNVTSRKSLACISINTVTYLIVEPTNLVFMLSSNHTSHYWNDTIPAVAPFSKLKTAMSPDFSVKLLAKKSLTHNVHAFTVSKPEGFVFNPGQATELSILAGAWRAEKRPFTFTSLPEDDTLEFTIKSYNDHEGVTKQLGEIEPGAMLEIGDPWGTIEYKGEGIFLAGGAGITPFIAILRDLAQRNKMGKNRLIFANKTSNDIILKEEFESILGNYYMNILSEENVPGSFYGHIDKAFLKRHISNFDQPFYVCGPEAFTGSILQALKELGAKPDALVFEK